jgi:antitoxin component YwqK of YwqJK toxin-antitoxin module
MTPRIICDTTVTVGILHIPTSSGTMKYTGEILNQKPHGKGQLFYPSGASCYYGSFSQGIKMGKGKLWNEAINGGSWLFYDGDFLADKKHGRGVLYLCDRIFDEEKNTFLYTGKNHRRAWVGYFFNDYANGQGKEFDAKGKLVYHGKVDMGLYHGRGKLYENGKLLYQGGWRNHKRHGQGTEFLDGIQNFKGKWKHDQKDLSEEVHRNHVALFLELDDAQKVSKVPLPFLRKYLQNIYQIGSKAWKRKDVLERLKEEHRKVKSLNTIHTEVEAQEDLFGNEITIPCFGDDGGVYDLQSMMYMFARNQQGEYENIPYRYDENDERGPSFRRMYAAKLLTHYSCPALDEWNLN